MFGGVGGGTGGRFRIPGVTSKAADRISQDSGICVDDGTASGTAGSRSESPVRKRAIAPGGTRRSGGTSYVRRLTQLFENLSHEEPTVIGSHGPDVATLPRPVFRSNWELNRVSEERAEPGARSDVRQALTADEAGGSDREEEVEPVDEEERMLVAAGAQAMKMDRAVSYIEDIYSELQKEVDEQAVDTPVEPVETEEEEPAAVAVVHETTGAAAAGEWMTAEPVSRSIRQPIAAISLDDKISDDEFDTDDDDEDDDSYERQVEIGQEAAEAHNLLVPQRINSQLQQHHDDDDAFSSSSFDSDSEDDAEVFITRPDSNSSLKTARVTNIMQELLVNEESYVQTLERGVENYISVMARKDLPPGLRGQKYHIFGNIERILQLHKTQFLPMLQSNRASIQGISETFIRFIENDKFYCYIMFALNRPKSERICNRNLDYFQQRQADVDDKLGLNSFLLQPIQRLPRYKLLLAEINKEILKQMDGTLLEYVKDEIGILCKAEKRLERFIDVVNEAMSINDIRECFEINLFHQGKFRKMFEVEIYDWDCRRRYSAKVFFFDRCALYSEKQKENLEYRGRYRDAEIGVYNENRNKVYLFARKRGKQEIEVQCNDINEAQQFTQFVEQMMTRFALRERERITDYSRRKEIPNRIPSVMTINRGSTISSSKSTMSMSSANSSRDSYEPTSQTTWDSDRPVESLVSVQKHFCHIMATNRRHYFEDLPDELSEKVGKFLRIFDQVLTLHNKRLYEDFAKPDVTMDDICELFVGYFKEGIFDVYNDYLRHFKVASEIMKNVYKATRTTLSDALVLSTIEDVIYLPVSHWNKYQGFFQAAVVRISEQLNDGVMANQELFRRLAYVEVQVTSFRKLALQNYRLFNVDDRMPPESLGLVLYSDRVRYDNETISSHRLLLCERAVVCVKINFVKEAERQAEKYVGFAFIDWFSPVANVKVSKKSEVRLNVLLVGTKHAVDFGNTPNRDKFFGQYGKAFARYR